MSAITTHVLDTAMGCPAQGVPVVLERAGAREWHALGRATTDADGRARNLLDGRAPLQPGTYRLVFDTTAYFNSRHVRGFYPVVIVTFSVSDGGGHYHVPLLLSPFGYSTYRGS